MLFNIYIIDTPFWDVKTAQETPGAPTFEYYALANTFNFSSGKILAPDQNVAAAIYDVHNNLGIIFGYSEEVNLTDFSWVIIQKKELKVVESYNREPTSGTLALMDHLAFESLPGYNKILESDNLVVVITNAGG
jgi:hypothetical protein